MLNVEAFLNRGRLSFRQFERQFSRAERNDSESTRISQQIHRDQNGRRENHAEAGDLLQLTA
jgi:hypothetical protein